MKSSTILKNYTVSGKSENILAAKTASYRKSFYRYGNTSKALKWKSKIAQNIRFREITKDIDFEGKSILDIGCGFGDLISHISGKTRKFDYTGVDAVFEFVEAARKKFPKHRFLVRDYFGNPFRKKYDVVVSSGALNSKVPGVMKYRKYAIKTAFEHANYAFAFNMAGGYPEPKNSGKSRIYYVDSLEMFKFCLSLTSKIIFRHNYRKNDFTIIMCR